MIRSSRRSFVVGSGCATAGAVFGFPTGATASVETVLDADRELRPLIDRERENILATMAKENISGAAICLVVDGKPAWIEGFGVVNDGSKRRVGPDTMFSIQSTSKNMTTTAILLAVQRGLLDLDRPIAAYLPEFKVNSRFEARPQDKMTLRHLLSSRAGFTHEAPVGNNNDPSFPSFEAHVDSISQAWLRFPMGDRFRYSNLGFDLAGYILQTAMKKPFAACLRTLLLDPLRMNDTTADTDEYSRHENRAIGHQNGYETAPLRIPFIPSGGVYSSARDLAAYLIFHLNQGKVGKRALLDPKLWNEMHSFSQPGAYSLGVAGGRLRFGTTDLWLLNHNGGGMGFGSVFRFYPQAQLGLAVLFNRWVGAAYQLGGTLGNEILTRRFGERRSRIRIEDFAASTLPEPELRKFVGNWLGRGYSQMFELDSGTLVMKQGEQRVPLRIASATSIVFPADSPVTDATQMTYFPAADGAPAHLESVLGETNLDYNDGPNDAPGPDKPAWDAYVGEYDIHYWGKPSQRVNIRRRNGYLYLDDIRLMLEHEPGLFFSGDGEAVDFRPALPTWRNIPLRRVNPA